MTPAPKRPRITRERVIIILHGFIQGLPVRGCNREKALRYAIRALKREQKAAKKKRSKR